MSRYRRRYCPGATYFFTVVTANRAPLFQDAAARRLLRSAFVATRRRWPFELWAAVLLSDHLHCIWILPTGDDDFSRRWALIKRTFTQAWLAHGGREAQVSARRRARREVGIWQRRFWEHVVRDEREQIAYRDYIHLNPVKHGYVADPLAWRWSSVHRHLKLGWLEPDWTGYAAVDVEIDVRGEV